MGRPLYTSILLARHATEAAVQSAPPKPTYPVVEKWSRWNAFDPDSDEFFEADDAVYEAFLSEEEIAERTQTQHRESARLLAERLLREANTIPSSSLTSEDSDHSIAGNDVTNTRISVAAQMETSDEMSDEGPRSLSEVRETQEIPLPEAPPRRQPRRAPAVAEWRLSSTGEISSNIPSISVIPAGSREVERASSPGLFSGLQILSDSPRPLIPVDALPRPISPIPNTPARVSGVFDTPPTSGQALTTPSPAPTVTPRVLTWGSQSIQFTPQWVPESPTSQDTPHFLGSLVPAPPPLTY